MLLVPSNNGDDGDDNLGSENRWSFSRQHRYDIKKPGPFYFVHEMDSGVKVSCQKNCALVDTQLAAKKDHLKVFLTLN